MHTINEGTEAAHAAQIAYSEARRLHPYNSTQATEAAYTAARTAGATDQEANEATADAAQYYATDPNYSEMYSTQAAVRIELAQEIDPARPTNSPLTPEEARDAHEWVQREIAAAYTRGYTATTLARLRKAAEAETHAPYELNHRYGCAVEN